MQENKLIAEFMGLEKVACNIGTEDGHFNEGYKHPKVNVPIIPSGMQYKYSWEWLMPVIEEIYDRVDKENIEEFYCFKHCIPNRDATYKAVVEFIEFYNQNK